MTNDTNDNKKTIFLHRWRQQVIKHLFSRGLLDAGQDLRSCGCSFKVDVCTTDINHSPIPIPMNCGLRICPDCAARESYRLLMSYMPALDKLVDENPDYPKYSLKHLVLTTPFNLKSLTAETFGEKQKLVKVFLEIFFFNHFQKLGQLSKAEIRRGRCDLAKHGIGGIQGAEFGEKSNYLHWHILIYCPYMPVNQIWSAWEQATGGKATNAKIYPLKPKKSYELTRADVLKAVKEIVKYTTKFTTIKPADVPHLHQVLKGNRRFRAFGILYNTQEKKEKKEHLCSDCNNKRDIVTVGEWLHICEVLHVAPSDVVTDSVDNGIVLYLSRYSSEISSGNDDKSHHKARDSIDGETYA